MCDPLLPIATYAHKVATLDTNLTINDHLTPASYTVTHTAQVGTRLQNRYGVKLSVGDMANFTCGAVGSNVDVLWEFEGSKVCDGDSTKLL